jgi:dTDP-4-dehydrorhamnose reductase
VRILLTGSKGQVGSALVTALAPLGELSAFDRNGLDLLDLNSIRSKIQIEKPGIIINAAAYTAVDRAEQERETAFAVNSLGVEELARQAKAIDALLIHFSTDYVFDGEKPAPYVETDAPNPLGVYGRSKLEGERAVAASGCRHFIFRTSWVYGPGGRNFVNAILAAAKTKPELRVVNDQRGAPTSSLAIAAAVATILADPSLRKKPGGIYHMTAAGETTWYEFAKEILALNGLRTPVVPVSSAEYGAPVRRPRNSLLDNTKLHQAFGVALPDWRQGLREVSSKIESH